jgi:RNA polymerase sigma-70 factor (ECF subfamily)
MLAGQERAWRVFVARYRRLILSTARTLLVRFNGEPRIEAEDVYAALLGSLVANDMAKLRGFDVTRGSKISTWLVTVTRNATWDHLRQARRTSALSLALKTNGTPTLSHCDALSTLAAREQCLQVMELINALPPRDREFFDLFYVDCASPEEIAAQMSISVKTVYTKNHKVRTKLEPALSSRALD